MLSNQAAQTLRGHSVRVDFGDLLPFGSLTRGCWCHYPAHAVVGRIETNESLMLGCAAITFGTTIVFIAISLWCHRKIVSGVTIQQQVDSSLPPRDLPVAVRRRRRSAVVGSLRAVRARLGFFAEVLVDGLLLPVRPAGNCDEKKCHGVRFMRRLYAGRSASVIGCGPHRRLVRMTVRPTISPYGSAKRGLVTAGAAGDPSANSAYCDGGYGRDSGRSGEPWPSG